MDCVPTKIAKPSSNATYSVERFARVGFVLTVMKNMFVILIGLVLLETAVEMLELILIELLGIGPVLSEDIGGGAIFVYENMESSLIGSTVEVT